MTIIKTLTIPRPATEFEKALALALDMTLPPGEDYILSNFNHDWLKIMGKVKN